MGDQSPSPIDYENASAELGFDPDLVRDRYRIERDKRLREDGSRQYRRVSGELAHYAVDPYTERVEREPYVDHVEVAVIGGGYGGLLLGARLREAGFDDIRLVEQGGDFGGTWYWNRYPGAACDTESYIYLPLLEETGYMPSEKYVKAPEILEHCHRIARHFDLYRNALLQTCVTDVRWSDQDSLWTISTDRGDAFRARFVIMTTGTFIKPKLPGIPGIEDFEGHSFHTTRWDYVYTGGDSRGNLTGLADKKVGLIGTGATSVQCLPHLGASAEEVFVFQRTPSSVGERNNRPTDPDWYASLEPGWQLARMANFSSYLAGGDAEEDLVKDGWTEIIRLFRGIQSKDMTNDVEAAMEKADFDRMEEIRKRCSDTVKDKATAEALKPYYRALCKRPCFHDEYLDTFNLPNVSLIDTDGRGVERVTKTGIVANGVEYPVDCIVFASGFQTRGTLAQRLGYDVYGRHGLSLTEKWKTGISTFFGMQTEGFPNLFIVSQAQVGISSNQTHPLAVQAEHIAFIIKQTRDLGARTVETTTAAEDAWVQRVIDASRTNVEFLESCTPGFYNNEGQPNGPAVRRNGAYAPGIIAFTEEITHWRAQGDLAGLVFAP
ncbi:MAG: Phenylacetone monooxygenase [Ilumatobacteraceae bacterium]|nr:Phenylacetone monooxygenase [Ilumatobacteraceae bacterium]